MMATFWRDTIKITVNDVERTVRGDVSPINADDNVAGTPTGIVTRFRFIVPADVDLGSSPDEASVYWLNGTGEGERYQPDGGLELHTMNGRPHHCEFVAKRYS